MKKSFGLFALCAVAGLTLTGCTSSSTDTSTLYDNYDETVYNTLGFNNKESWTALKTYADDATDYTTIKVAAVPELFVIYTDLDTLIAENGSLVKSVNVPTLAFTELRSDTQSSIISELYNEEYGITASKIGLASTQSLNVKSYNLTGVSIQSSLDAYNAGTKGNTLAIVYLPVYVNQKKSSKTYSVSHVLIPVYYEISSKTAFDVSDYTVLNAEDVIDSTTHLLKNKAAEE